MYIKGFDKNLKCRDFQFEIGETYESKLYGTKQKLIVCKAGGFHFCETIQNVDAYYNVDANNRFCEVKPLGRIVKHDDKLITDKIEIIREIKGDELNILIGKINGNTGLFNSGDYNSGDYNSGCFNSGNRNSGYRNSGWFNSGNGNSGDYNSGCFNSGNRNSGDHNSGMFNSCDFSNGVFCTKMPTIKMFNIDTNMTYSEFMNSKYYYAIYSSDFPLTEWKNDRLITHTYQEACAIWWEKMSDENKKIIMSMPNFDKDIFKEITGIELG